MCVCECVCVGGLKYGLAGGQNKAFVWMSPRERACVSSGFVCIPGGFRSEQRIHEKRQKLSVAFPFLITGGI